MNNEVPTLEELRPVLEMGTAIVALHALIGKAGGGPVIEHDDVLHLTNTAIDFAQTLMACLSANSLDTPPRPDTIPLAYDAGVNEAQDRAVQELRETSHFSDLPDDFKRLIGRACTAIQNHDDGIPF